MKRVTIKISENYIRISESLQYFHRDEKQETVSSFSPDLTKFSQRVVEQSTALCFRYVRFNQSTLFNEHEKNLKKGKKEESRLEVKFKRFQCKATRIERRKRRKRKSETRDRALNEIVSTRRNDRISMSRRAPFSIFIAVGRRQFCPGPYLSCFLLLESPSKR